MLVNPVGNKTQIYTQKLCQSTQFREVAHSYNTNLLACDTFSPSVSFKAAIHVYAREGNINGVEKELEKGANINTKNFFGLTPLMLAVQKHNVELVKKLLQYPDIDVNAVDCGDNTALSHAIFGNLNDIALELLRHPDIDLDKRDSYGRTALDLAEEMKYYEIVGMIEWNLTEEAKEAKKTAKFSQISKRIAVDINKLSPEENIWSKAEISNEFLKLVKDDKYDEAEKMLQVTPLIDLLGNDKKVLNAVCRTGNADFVRKVFEYEKNQPQKQADYDVKRKEFLENTIKTLGYDELKTNNIALNTIDGFRIMMERQEFNPNDMAGKATLFEVACGIDFDGNLVKEILSKYGDVNTANAAYSKNQIIKDLINDYEKVGKYKIILNKIEDLAFYADERRGVAANQLKELLESPNFTPEIADEVGNSVLHIAAALPDDMGRTLIQMALDKGVGINAENCTGQRPLMSAIKRLVTTEDRAGKMNLMANIKFLLDKGADINVQDNNGQTAFHFACMSTVTALLTLLLSHEPNILLKDKYGQQAVKYLKTQEMKDIYNKSLAAV